MRIPSDAFIPTDKITDYLLVSRPWDDKSKFLAQAGFRRAEPDVLREALRELTAECEAVEDGVNEYGTFLRVEGELAGLNGRRLDVVTIWLQWHSDGSVHFVTLKPRRG